MECQSIEMSHDDDFVQNVLVDNDSLLTWIAMSSKGLLSNKCWIFITQTDTNKIVNSYFILEHIMCFNRWSVCKHLSSNNQNVDWIWM